LNELIVNIFHFVLLFFSKNISDFAFLPINQ